MPIFQKERTPRPGLIKGEQQFPHCHFTLFHEVSLFVFFFCLRTWFCLAVLHPFFHLSSKLRQSSLKDSDPTTCGRTHLNCGMKPPFITRLSAWRLAIVLASWNSCFSKGWWRKKTRQCSWTYVCMTVEM